MASKPYVVSSTGAYFGNDDDNPTFEEDITYSPASTFGGRDYPESFTFDGQVYPYGKFRDDGTIVGDFTDYQHSMTREELTAYRDMLTELLDRSAQR